MKDFIRVADKQSDDLSRLVLLNTRHISEVRPVGNPISGGSLVIMSNGREIRTEAPFDKLSQELYG